MGMMLVIACGGGGDPVGDANDVSTDSALTVANFRGTGTGKAVKLHWVDAKFVPVSKEVKKLAKDLTEANTFQNNSFYAAVYQAPRDSFADFDSNFNHYFVRNEATYQMMFRVDGSAPGDDTPLGFYAKWDPEVETIGCRVIDRSKAHSRFKHFQAYVSSHGDPQNSAKARSFEANATALVSSFLKGAAAGARLYRCHWDNNDDTDADALILLDDKGGEVRVLLAFAGA